MRKILIKWYKTTKLTGFSSIYFPKTGYKLAKSGYKFDRRGEMMI